MQWTHPVSYLNKDQPRAPGSLSPLSAHLLLRAGWQGPGISLLLGSLPVGSLFLALPLLLPLTCVLSLKQKQKHPENQRLAQY